MLSEGSLRVHRVQLSDAGRYYCTVSNPAGSDHRGVDLRVFGEYSSFFMMFALDDTFSIAVCSTCLNVFSLLSVGPFISPGPFNVTVTSGIRAVLSCETTGIPPPKVSWKRNGTPLDISQQPGAYR